MASVSLTFQPCWQHAALMPSSTAKTGGCSKCVSQCAISPAAHLRPSSRTNAGITRCWKHEAERRIAAAQDGANASA